MHFASSFPLLLASHFDPSPHSPSEVVSLVLDAATQLQDTSLSLEARYRLFEQIEALATPNIQQADAVLSRPEILAVRPLLRQGYQATVFELECATADQLLHASACLPAALSTYPKHDQYLRRAVFELNAIRLRAGQLPRCSLLVGSGPLPMTALILVLEFGLAVDLLDWSSRAIAISRNVLSRFVPMATTRFHQADAHHFTDYGQYDAVFVAGSVGEDDEDKSQIIATIHRQLAARATAIFRLPCLLECLLQAAPALDCFPNTGGAVALDCSASDILYSVVLGPS